MCSGCSDAPGPVRENLDVVGPLLHRPYSGRQSAHEAVVDSGEETVDRLGTDTEERAVEERLDDTDGWSR